ncbi:MAG TPA: N-acetylmuramoyl-L-alanine amidase [Candidatus Sulfotelmatobacter sp.]|nr:N-acetylmuramoyl-L-alanine amidase [Candidatus Sulfotelmatobacter sp.]
MRRQIPALIVLCSLLTAAPAEKHLSVYSLAANYSMPVVQREGRDYIGLLELLEPLGKVSAKSDNNRWRLRYNNVEGDFQLGKTRALVQGRDADLTGKFLMENKRGLVPVSSLASLLPRLLGGPVTLHEDSERLFIGNIATHFTASLSGENPPRLVLHFTSPVNPSIATEPGTVRMTFSRDPLVAPASPTLTFGNKAIPSASYSEANGNAVLTVNSTIPLMASFANDGRTITIAATSSPATQNAQSPAQGPSNPSSNSASAGQPQTSTPTAQTPTLAAPTAPPIPRRYFAVVDASHGGDDHGETLSTTLLEKDITVALARSLRQELESRAITTLVLRDSDANLSVDQRAMFANADHAAIYIALHAASSGRGVRVYTALLPYGGNDRGPFRDWTTAQHNSLPLSQSTATAISNELQKRQIPVRSLEGALRPLNNITGPAIAIEVAPQGSDVSQLTAPDYQQLITSAVATAIANARDQLGAAQ